MDPVTDDDSPNNNNKQVEQNTKNTQTSAAELLPSELSCKQKEELKCLKLMQTKDDSACAEPKCRPQTETGTDYSPRPMDIHYMNCTKNTQTTDKDPFYAPRCKQVMQLASCTKKTQTSTEEIVDDTNCLRKKQKKVLFYTVSL